MNEQFVIFKGFFIYQIWEAHLFILLFLIKIHSILFWFFKNTHSTFIFVLSWLINLNCCPFILNMYQFHRKLHQRIFYNFLKVYLELKEIISHGDVFNIKDIVFYFDIQSLGIFFLSNYRVRYILKYYYLAFKFKLLILNIQFLLY